jgi:putative redox protein
MAIRPVALTTTAAKFAATLKVGPHTFTADESVDGGEDKGLAPFELLGSALAACTSMTLRGYAQRKSWPLERVDVTVEQEKTPEAHKFKRTLTLVGPLDAEQTQRLLDIANKCPVHKALTGKIEIATALTST